ncbi:MAG TPA: hypothetical protein VHY84_27760 [Bryobacteraceae bacterium]|jgi:hypothetical protein|nr:hypothetical protein [Bryobacteraceae bacterium]
MRLFLHISVPFLLLLVSANPAAAQLFGFGIEGGARLSTDTHGTIGSINSESKRYIVGPRVDVHLSHSFSVEVDALYRNVAFSAFENSPVVNELIRERANSWEFPAIVKYRYPGFRAHPFLGAGYDPRVVHGADITNGAFASGVVSGITTYTYLLNQQSPTNYKVTNGAVVSGGMDFVAGPVHISPELRFVHWVTPFLNVNQSGSAGSSRFNSSRNELFILFGITWH